VKRFKTKTNNLFFPEVVALGVVTEGDVNSAEFCFIGRASLYVLASKTKLVHTFFFVRGSFQKFYTLYVFFLKINLFYKINLQAFNVISIVL
jgi:hypothetical protein